MGKDSGTRNREFSFILHWSFSSASSAWKYGAIQWFGLFSFDCKVGLQHQSWGICVLHRKRRCLPLRAWNPGEEKCTLCLRHQQMVKVTIQLSLLHKNVKLNYSNNWFRISRAAEFDLHKYWVAHAINKYKELRRLKQAGDSENMLLVMR